MFGIISEFLECKENELRIDIFKAIIMKINVLIFYHSENHLVMCLE